MFDMELEIIRKNAIEHIDYYKQGGSENYDFPIICKRDIQSHYSSFLTHNMDESLRSAIIDNLNDKSKKCVNSYNELSQIGEYVIEETTGTSGSPLRVVKSVSERAILGLNLYRCRKAVDRKFEMRHFKAFNHTTLRQDNPKPYDFDENHIVKIYKELCGDRVRWLHTSIIPLKKHIEILEKHGIKEFPDLQFIELTGNYLDKDDVDLVENYFSAKVTNLYGCMETWAIAYGTSHESFDICENVVKVEIADDDGNILHETGEEGNIIISSLVCNTMPIIRYKTGDIGKIVVENGKEKLVLKEGRTNQYIKGLDFKVLGTKQFGNIIKMTLQKTNISEIPFIQFVQKEIDYIQIKICDFDGIDSFIPVLLPMIEERLNKKYRFEIIVIDREEAFKKENAKRELFICNV